MFFNLFSIIVFQCILIFVAIKSVINRKIYKRFRMIKKKKREKKDISEIEKLKKCVLLNKLLLFWSINISILTKYFHEIYLFIKNTFTKDYSENFLIFPSFFFFLFRLINVLGNFQLNNSFTNRLYRYQMY